MVKQGGTLKGVRTAIMLPRQQADAFLSQVNPVSNFPYVVLPPTPNVRLISMAIAVDWALNQPTNLRAIVTVDGIPITFTIAAPASGTIYLAETAAFATAANQLFGANEYSHYYPFLLEGRTVGVQLAITWAITQPTPIVLRVKWARW